MNGFAAPANDAANLAASDTIFFQGEYSIKNAELEIVVDPDGVLVPWMLTGDDGFERSGQGPTTLIDLPPGDYVLTRRKIAFVARGAGNDDDIFVYEMDTGSLHAVTADNGLYNDRNPSWGPNSIHIMFERDNELVISRYSSGVVDFVDNNCPLANGLRYPVWSPTTNRVYFLTVPCIAYLDLGTLWDCDAITCGLEAEFLFDPGLSYLTTGPYHDLRLAGLRTTNMCASPPITSRSAGPSTASSTSGSPRRRTGIASRFQSTIDIRGMSAAAGILEHRTCLPMLLT